MPGTPAVRLLTTPETGTPTKQAGETSGSQIAGFACLDNPNVAVDVRTELSARKESRSPLSKITRIKWPRQGTGENAGPWAAPRCGRDDEHEDCRGKRRVSTAAALFVRLRNLPSYAIINVCLQQRGSNRCRLVLVWGVERCRCRWHARLARGKSCAARGFYPRTRVREGNHIGSPIGTTEVVPDTKPCGSDFYSRP
jgi:hypothetical protein